MDNIIVINTDDIKKVTPEMNFNEIRAVHYNSESDVEVAIMILAYNRLEKTKTCIEYILKYTLNIPYKLILVDNGSDDNEIFEYFKSINHDKDIIRITKNIGTGIYAMTKVTRMINNKFLVIVANDIIVTPNWLSNLYACAVSDDRIGMVCPVSTNISNLQQETLGGFADLDEMIQKAEAFNKSNPLLWEERSRIIPTATLYRTEVFRTIGEYDPGFIHDFGDDDFSFRVRRGGYKLIVCRDTFVHHNHNVAKMEDKNEELAISLTKKGWEDFKKKHDDINPWDVGPIITSKLQCFNWSKEKNEKLNVLSLEPKYGLPLLDIKNVLTSKGYRNIHTVALSSEPKYYIDLSTSADDVLIGNTETLLASSALNILSGTDNLYDAIEICKPINEYDKPREVLHNAVSSLCNGGFLYFELANAYDFRTLLCSLNMKEFRNPAATKLIHYQDILNILSDYKLSGIEIEAVPGTVNEVHRKLTLAIASKLFDSAKINDALNNLFTSKYLFYIRK